MLLGLFNYCTVMYLIIICMFGLSSSSTFIKIINKSPNLIKSTSLKFPWANPIRSHPAKNNSECHQRLIYSGGKPSFTPLRTPLHNLKYYHEIFVRKKMFVFQMVRLHETERLKKDWNSIFFFLFIVYKEKLTKLNFAQFQDFSSQHYQYQSQQITSECVQN